VVKILVCAFYLMTGQLVFSQQRATGVNAAFDFADSVFKSPVVSFEINELRPSDSLLAIMTKLNNALAENKEWAAEYMNKNYKAGEGMPCNEKANSMISFRGADSFRILNYLEFQQAGKTVRFGGDTILFTGEVNASVATPFGRWHGYSWHYEKSNQADNADINIHQLSAKIIEIDIGTTIPGNRNFLRIKYEEVEHGEKKAYMELMGFLE
jgi:hypothetical protein